MGGAQSCFNETDWDLADGSLRTSDETMDGRPPTTKYQTYDLVKRSIVANQREIDVTDSEKNLLFHVRPSPGTIAGFDVLGIGSANKDEYILRVTVDLARRSWIIYRFDKPIFDGQKPDPVATEKFAIEQQVATNDRKELAARISASLAIHSFSDDTPVEIPASTPIVPKHFLYKVGCVTVSWSRYMAVAAYFGPPTIDQIMQATEAACKRELKSKKTTTIQNENESDDDGDILNEARKIAGRLREEREGMDENERSNKATPAVTNADSKDDYPDSKNDNIVDSTVIDESLGSPILGATTMLDVELEISNEVRIGDSLKNDLSSPTENETHAGDGIKRPTEGSNEIEQVEHNHNANKQNHSLADDLADESESDIDLSNDNAHTYISESLSHQENTKDNYSIQANDSLDIQTSASMPELSHSEKTASPRILANGLQKWWQENSRNLHEKSIAMLRPKGMSEDFTNTTTPSGTSGIPAALDTSGSSKHSGTGPVTNEGTSSVGVASFLGIGKTSNVDDPLQGVVHLDKPLLLCQEIYTRIIGNHQTSKVTKEKVLTLLRQDMEQHLQNRKEDDEVESVGNDVTLGVSTDSLSLSNCTEPLHNNISLKPDLNVTTTSTTVKSENMSPTPVANASSSEGYTGNEESTKVISLEQPSQPPPKEQPLVGYWVWENTLRTHKMKMHLAKGSDLALHIVLAVLVNQLRYERNAIAIAV